MAVEILLVSSCSHLSSPKLNLIPCGNAIHEHVNSEKSKLCHSSWLFLSLQYTDSMSEVMVIPGQSFITPKYE